MKTLLFSLLLITFATPGLAEVIVTEKVTYFTVSGRNPKQISRSMQQNSPVKGKKSFAAATTRTQINYEFNWKKRGKRCSIEKVKLYLNLTYTYPRLVTTPDRKTDKWWKEQLKIYIRHEREHGNISKRTAHEIDRQLRQMDDLNCATMKEEVKRRVKYFTRKMNDRHDEFDRKEQRKH